MVVANPYSQQTIQQRIQQPAATNQFSPPPATNNIQPPNFYHIGTGGTRPGGGGGNQMPVDPRYDAQYNPNFSGPIYNPYAPPTPYGANKVSPTGAVQGIAPQGPGNMLMARSAGTGDNGSGPNGGQNAGGGGGNKQGGGGGGNGGNNNGGGGNGGGNGGGGGGGKDNQKGDQGTFLQGFYNLGKNPNDQKAEAFLRSDPALQDTLHQLLGSRGDYVNQFRRKRGDIEDTWRTAKNYLTAERGSALQDMEGGLASSGLTRSSGALGELSGIRRDFGNQIEQARQAKTGGMTDIITERQNFMRQLELAKLQARSDALRRFAAEQMDVGGLL